MSWQDIMQRMLPPIRGVLPHITSPYGASEGRPLGSSNPHRGVDFNYFGRQSGINLTHPALRSPVTGIVTKAGQDKYGTVTIRDANGFSHTILHTDSQHVTVGDPVASGQLIGTMGNTGAVQQHVHYQLKDPAGNLINPSAFWDQQGPVEPIPNPPAYLQEYQKYLQSLGRNASNGFGKAPNMASAPTVPFVQQDVLSSDRQDHLLPTGLCLPIARIRSAAVSETGLQPGRGCAAAIPRFGAFL
jgi:murein DD-endopeptidase MepM/ murein hydrolase activator NlpD